MKIEIKALYIHIQTQFRSFLVGLMHRFVFFELSYILQIENPCLFFYVFVGFCVPKVKEH